MNLMTHGLRKRVNGMGKNNVELLKIAEKYLGCGGSKFRKFCGLPAGAAWCNAYVDTIAAEGDDSQLYFAGKKMTYCPTSIKWCQQNLAQIPIYLALPMDIIYFDWELNGVPNHIGFVRERKSDQEVYTIEGNTSGGIVAKRTRPVKYVQGVFRPHFPAAWKDGKLDVDGYFGYNSIAMLQKALGIKQDGILGKGTVKALQKRAGVKQDGAFGPATAKAVQKMIGTTVDGDFGPKSVKALQEWINKVTASTPSAGDKIVAEAKKFCWPEGTAEKKWSYKTGSPLAVYKAALKKYMGATTKAALSDCGYFVTTCVRASGISKSFFCLKGNKDPFPAVPSTMKIVHKGAKIPSGLLKPGDIIRYKKDSGSQHALIYMGNGRIAEAGRDIRFPVIRKSTKYNDNAVKHSTLQVIRAKETTK